MRNNEWRLKLDAARKQLIESVREEFLAQAETQILRALRAVEEEYLLTHRSLLNDFDVVDECMLSNAQDEEVGDTTAFNALAAQLRGKVQKTGLERARSERDVAREVVGGMSIEFLLRAWLEQRLKQHPNTPRDGKGGHDAPSPS